jgi:hypothetical protein
MYVRICKDMNCQRWFKSTVNEEKLARFCPICGKAMVLMRLTDAQIKADPYLFKPSTEVDVASVRTEMSRP